MILNGKIVLIYTKAKSVILEAYPIFKRKLSRQLYKNTKFYKSNE